MANGNTSGRISRKQFGGFGLCFLGIAVWILMSLKILVQTGMLDEIAWLAMGGSSWPLEFAVGLLCFIQGRRMLCQAPVEAKPDDDSSSTD